MGASATASVADVIDSFKFTAGDVGFSNYAGVHYGIGTSITSPDVTLGKFIGIDPGNQGKIVQCMSSTSGLFILRIESDHFATGRDIALGNPSHTFDYMVVKNSAGVEIAELEMLACLENNSTSANRLDSRLFFWINNSWLGGGNNTRPYSVTVTVVDADTFTVPLTLTRKNRVVPSGASETFTGSTGKVHKSTDSLGTSAGTSIGSSSLSSNVLTINTSSSHGLTTGDTVDLSQIGHSSFDPNTIEQINLTGGYGGSAMMVDGQDYTVELRNRL